MDAASLSSSSSSSSSDCPAASSRKDAVVAPSLRAAGGVEGGEGVEGVEGVVVAIAAVWPASAGTSFSSPDDPPCEATAAGPRDAAGGVEGTGGMDVADVDNEIWAELASSSSPSASTMEAAVAGVVCFLSCPETDVWGSESNDSGRWGRGRGQKEKLGRAIN